MNVHKQAFSSGASLLNSSFDWAAFDFSGFPLWFDNHGELIHSDRNALKVFSEIGEIQLENPVVVKSFKVPSLLSRAIYSYFRSSKARRSFENSMLLLQQGFATANPVAMFEFNQAGLLEKSFYISEQLVFDCSMHEVFRKQMFELEDVLPLVVEEAFHMHKKGFLHLDFSPGNILVTKKETFSFAFVDLNRLYRGNVGFERGLRSFIRLANNDLAEKIIIECYSKLWGEDSSKAQKILAKHLSRHRKYKSFKKNLKKKLGMQKKLQSPTK